MATFASGTYVWVPEDDECFVPARVNTKFKAGSPGSVTLINMKKSSSKGKASQLSAKETGKLLAMDEQSLTTLDNMVELKQLNEASILHNLRERFKKDEIYTNIGSILVSINPFKLLPIYTPRVLDKYLKQGSRNMPPHVFGVADNAYKALRGFGKSQSCIVSGESGAGKTEATKLFLQYIAEVSGGVDDKASKSDSKKDKKGGDSKSDSKVSIQSQVLEANPLMEAFGNAKTVRNDNSSRFGKWIEIEFEPKAGGIVGASITSYLLEKSRLVHQAEGERNYHIFYQLCAAASMDPVFEKLKLQDAAQYFYLNQSSKSCTTVKGMDDVREYEATTQAMEVMGVSSKEKEAIVTLLAGVLHLGNIDFEGNDKSKVKNKDMLKLASAQLGTKPDTLEKALVKRSVGAGKEVVFADQNPEQAKASRDAFAKGLYGLLFDWLIAKINKTLTENAKSQGKGGKSKGKGSSSSIGVLDIFGFESFEKNSFEQLCINFCNEKLQGHFNEHIFKLEQEEYKREGLDISKISYEDNSHIINMLEGKQKGVFARIDEELITPRGSNETLLVKILNAADGKILVKPESKDMRSNPALKACFTVTHYAGPVSYNITGFMEKNKDKLQADLVAIGKSSKESFIKSLFDGVDQDSKSNKKTLGSQFKLQLNDLMGTLNATEPHYIRCIKPNSEKEGDIFTSPMVLAQLRYAGLLEVCRIRQVGYPVRKDFKEFLNRYRPLYTKAKDLKHLCKGLEGKDVLVKDEYQIGKSKVFLRTLMFNTLEGKREKALGGIVVQMQKIARGFVMRKRFKLYQKILKDLKKHMKSKDEEKIEMALLETGQLPYQGKNNKYVKEAHVLIDRIREERALLKTLRDAMKKGNAGSISGAIKACKDMSLDKHEDVKAAESLLKGLKDQTSVKEDLRKAMKSKDLSELTSLLKKAEKMKMGDLVEFRDATALKERLEGEKETKAALTKAIKKKDTKEINKMMSKMVEMGCGSDPLVAEGEKITKTAAEMSVAQTNQIAQTEKELEDAIKEKDLERLNELEVKVIKLGMSGKLVEEALEMRATLEKDANKATKLDSEVKALTIKAGSLGGVTKSDIDPLKKMIKETLDSGVDPTNSVVVAAKSLERRMKDQLKAESVIEDALSSNTPKDLKAALGKANELGMQTTAVKKLQAAVRALQADGLSDKRRDVINGQFQDGANEGLKHPTKADLQKVAMQRLAKSNSKTHRDRIEKASKEFYNFTKFFQIRTDEDYTQNDLPLLKKMRADTKLSYQSRRISNSILELDKDLAKVAIRNHKAMLGYTGDVASNAFSTTLAQDVIIRGLEIPEIIDEIYVQLCKHLTRNSRKESMDRGWLLLCMCTKHFPPSKDFELYLMNFLIDHRGVQGLIGNYARLCLFQLDSTISLGATNLIPPLYDIKMYTKRPPILADVHSVDGTSASYAVTPDITVAMLVGMCATFARMNTKVSKQFGIFVKDSDFAPSSFGGPNQGQGPQLKRKKSGLALPVSSAVEAAMDMFDGASKFLGFTQRKPLPSPQSSWPLMGATFPGDVYLRMAKQGREPIFSFKRKLMLSPKQDPDVDRDLYLQLLDEVLFGNLLIKEDADRFNLVAIAMAAKSTKFPKNEKALLDQGLMKFVPITWRMRTPVDEWAKQVHKAGTKYADMDPKKLHSSFVKICRKSSVYGMCFFSVYRQDNNKDYICGINHEGVHLLNEKLELLWTFDYRTIQKFGASARYVWIKVAPGSVTKDLAPVFAKNNSILQLYTLQSTEMYGLLFDYTHYNVA